MRVIMRKFTRKIVAAVNTVLAAMRTFEEMRITNGMDLSVSIRRHGSLLGHLREPKLPHVDCANPI